MLSPLVVCRSFDGIDAEPDDEDVLTDSELVRKLHMDTNNNTESLTGLRKVA